MLVRTFRLTDKFSNAALRVAAWIGQVLLIQALRLRLALVSSLEALWFTLTQSLRSGHVIYQSSEERRSAMMARRAAEAATRPAIREDPLKTQNRALSMFTVVLMTSLLLIVLWFTASGQVGLVPPRLAAANGVLPLKSDETPTLFPAIAPTASPMPSLLEQGGSIAYTQRQNGHDSIWAIEIGRSTPIRLTNSPAGDRDPAWSPDGSKLAFASRRDGNWELYVIDVGTGTTSRLTYDLDYEGAPTWSPDGKFIAYEAYKNNNLDIYIIASDGTSNPIQLTHNPAPDFSPAWSPDGRHIAYVSLRDGNQEIYIINLARPSEDEAVRLTNTPDVDEDHPVWSPDGQTIAYTAHVNGLSLVFAKSVTQPDADPVIVGQGRDPAWSPNGASLLLTVDNNPSTMLIAAQVGAVGASALAYSIPSRASHPQWSGVPLPASLLQSGGNLVAAPAVPLYKENVAPLAKNPPYSRLALLQGIKASNPYLADKVDDSFIALREAVVQQAGFDFLGNLKEALWGMDRIPEPGQSRQSWHFAGRAFDFDKNLVFNDPAPIEVVREDIGVNTYWRVYIRVPDQLQGGQIGEPLKQLPWDFASRSSGDPQAFEGGGRKKAAVPSGYYVDFTQLAEDYGWMRIPAERTWRSVYASILYWEFDKREGMSWNDAMLDLYGQDQIAAFLSGPTLVPTPVAPPSETPTRGPAKTPTPPLPDNPTKKP